MLSSVHIDLSMLTAVDQLLAQDSRITDPARSLELTAPIDDQIMGPE